MQRTRERGTLYTTPWSFKQYRRTWNTSLGKWNAEVLVKNTTQSSSVGWYERMEDIYRKAPKKRVSFFEDVLPLTHTKLAIENSDGYPGWWYSTSTKTEQLRNVYAAYGVTRTYAESVIPAIPSSESLPHRAALDQFNAGGVATELSLPNFLLELGEIKGLLSMVNPLRLYKAFKGKNLDKEVSGGFLGYNFGLAPLLDDLSVIASYTDSLQKRLDWLMENRGQVVSLDYRETLSKEPPQNTAPPTTTSGTWIVWGEYKATYHAFCRWKVDYEPLHQAFEKLSYFNRYFGTKRLLTAAWNALPYSFIVDWVTNLGRLLTQFEIPTGLRKDITCLGFSTKQSGKFKVHAGWCPLWNPEAQQVAATVEFTRYNRSPGLPLTFQEAFDLSDATGKQQALAMALIHQKI